MSKKDDDLVNLDEGENWTVTFRTNKLKKMGWKGTLREWQDAMELLNANPLSLEPPAKSLEEAKKRAKRK
jgi:hypothetical protein